MDRRVAFALIVVAQVASIARADPRDVFGLQPKSVEPPLDCSDGSAFGCAAATDPLADAVPYALSTWLSRQYLMSLPVGDATHDQVAHYAMGVGQDEAGPSFAGANGLENRWTIDGAPADNITNGGADTKIPLAFLDGILVTAGGFAARDRASTGGTIDARLRRGGDHHELEVYAWLTYNAHARQAPEPTQTYNVRQGTYESGPAASAAIVATGPLGSLLGGRAWYAAGIAPKIAATEITWNASTLVDADNDGVPDGLPGLLTTQPVSTDHRAPIAWSVPVMARAGVDSGPHHLELTLIGSGGGDTRYNLFNSTLQAGAVDQTNFVGDGIATWRGTWDDTHARVQLAWHRSQHSESAHDPNAANMPQTLSAYVPTTLADDPKLAAACADGGTTDLFPKIPNCPVLAGWFYSGGAGPLANTTADRPSITADVAHQIGNNVIRIGATGEDSRLVTTTHFTGGEQLISVIPGEMAVRQFVDGGATCSQDPTQPCPTATSSTLSYRTRYTAAYVEDTFRPAPNISVDGGLRWELMWVGTTLHFSDELAPHLGITWDPLGNGRSRVWASMGRSFALLPAGLGTTILAHDRTVDEITFMGGSGRAVDNGQPVSVAADIQAIAQDELTSGVEVALARTVRATAWVQGHWLVRGLDTTQTSFANPGQDPIDAPASRNTGLFAAQLETSPTSRLALRVGYLYQRTFGSWTGAFDPRQGVVLYGGSDYDFTSDNQLGQLPTDLGHRLYIEAERRGSIGPVKLAVTTRLTAGSGRPRDILGDSSELGVVYLLPRGSAGRGPLITQANFRIAASWRGYDVTLDLLNLFDRRDPTNLDQVYASAQPIENGTMSDLVFLRSDSGAPAIRHSSFDLPTAYQAPFAAVLGVHRSF